MTQDEIVEMTLQAGWTGIYSQWISPTERQHLTVPVTIEQIETFAHLVAAKEREACAKECEHTAQESDSFTESILRATATQIRARGEQA